jgi:membrane-bound lytic murein transglycosylase F
MERFSKPIKNNYYNKLRYILMSACVFFLLGCDQQNSNSILKEIKQRDVIKVGILSNPTSYYVDTNGPTGFEHDLVVRFAEYLDVEIEFIPSYHVAELLPKLERGQVDILVGGLAKTESRSERFRYSPPYMYVSQKMVFKQGRKRPIDFDELDGPVTVASQTSHYETLLNIQKDNSNFDINVSNTADPNELLEMLIEENIDYTVADSHNLAIVRRYFPDISVAFTVEEKQPISWLLQNNTDDSLYAVLIDFFGEMYSNGELLALEDRYFGHVESFNYVDTRLFMKAVDKVLPKYKNWFEQYAGDIDWRLLAAQSYQESHWNPRAKSPTGVRGIMMLTQPTAKQVGVKSRLDAESNIRGGAVYMRKLLNRIPDRISEHDKPWFALAAYNVGWGHVQDARRLTEKGGGDPDKWVDVKRYLPLLRQKRYYKQTRYGFARGDEAVNYVANIRRYYDTLVWLDEKSLEDQKREQLKEPEEQEIKPQLAL